MGALSMDAVIGKTNSCQSLCEQKKLGFSFVLDSAELNSSSTSNMLIQTCHQNRSVGNILFWPCLSTWISISPCKTPLMLPQMDWSKSFSHVPDTGLTLILPFATIVALGGSASSKARHTYNIPHATIQSKCSHTGVNLLSYKHATFH